MSDWNMEPVIGKLKRRGIIEQRPVPHSKRKKIAKPWTVYVLRLLNYERWVSIKRDPSRWIDEYNFATEDQAIRYAEKKRREHQYPHWDGRPDRDRVWVAEETSKELEVAR